MDKSTPTPPTNLEDEFNQAFGMFDIEQVDSSVKPVDASKILAEISPEGGTVDLKDLVGETLVVHRIEGFVGEYGPALHVVGTDSKGVVFNTTIGGKVLAPKLWMLRTRLPVRFTLTHQEGGQFGGYYDLE